MDIELPEKFIQKLSSFVPEINLLSVLSSFDNPTLPAFRVNTLKITTEEAYKILTAYKYILSPVPWYKDAFTLENKSIRELTEISLYKEGSIYIQNLSSMIPALVLNPKQGEKMLDLAAAPGSKTTQAACLMNNSGQIVANDISRSRTFRLLENLKSQGVTNTKITNIPGQRIWQRYPEQFDKTLLDAPCSMEGRFKTYESKSYQDWTPRKVKLLSQLQKYLLRSAVSATKIGGTVVYSTCTLSPEENEEVIDWILRKEGDAIEIAPIALPNLIFIKGIGHYGNKTYDDRVQNTARILPNENMEGFFIAKIKKTKSTLDKLFI